MSDETYLGGTSSWRYRPKRRVAPPSNEAVPQTLVEGFEGVAAAYGDTLLFVGYEIDGLVEITVYPRYRFSSDDRVQGQLGYVYVPFGTPWEEILGRVDEVYQAAQRNYRTAVETRASELRAHGLPYESAYDSITEIFRESWHSFALRLEREGRLVRGQATFEGTPPGPVLVTWGGDPFTLEVFATGSILLMKGDRRTGLRRQLGVA